MSIITQMLIFSLSFFSPTHVTTSEPCEVIRDDDFVLVSCQDELSWCDNRGCATFPVDPDAGKICIGGICGECYKSYGIVHCGIGGKAKYCWIQVTETGAHAECGKPLPDTAQV